MKLKLEDMSVGQLFWGSWFGVDIICRKSYGRIEIITNCARNEAIAFALNWEYELVCYLVIDELEAI